MVGAVVGQRAGTLPVSLELQTLVVVHNVLILLVSRAWVLRFALGGKRDCKRDGAGELQISYLACVYNLSSPVLRK